MSVLYPTENPTMNPTFNPSNNPTINPTNNPTVNPTINPTLNPTINPTVNPSKSPSDSPTPSPVILNNFDWMFNYTITISSLLASNYNQLLVNGYNELSTIIENSYDLANDVFVRIINIDGTPISKLLRNF